MNKIINKRYGGLGAGVGIISAVFALKKGPKVNEITQVFVLLGGAIIGYLVIPPVYSYLLDKNKPAKP